MSATSDWIPIEIEPKHREDGSPDSPNLLINFIINEEESWSDQVIGYYAFESKTWYSQETDEPIAGSDGDITLSHYAYITEPNIQ